MKDKFDFSGWATRNDLVCTDSRVIKKDAFKHMDGQWVPIVWQHQHNSVENVLGKGLLENRPEGVYLYGKFNSTPSAEHAKEMVQHGDITSLSIHAVRLKNKGNEVLHGDIKEVSLVLAGANPGAYIDFPILSHGEESDKEAIIYTGFDLEEEKEEMGNVQHKDNQNEKTVKDVYDSFTEEQKQVVHFMIGQALLSKEGDDGEDDVEHSDGGYIVKKNLFENNLDANEGLTLTHDDQVSIINEAKKNGSLKEAFIQHAATYGIDNIDVLYPEAKNVNDGIELYKRNTEWVDVFLSGIKKSPFAKIKSLVFDLTEKEARAKGYIKGTQKLNEVIKAAKRITHPQTVYKKQKLDRDDIVDITDFDITMEIKKEMRIMLDEELAMSMLAGDGRENSDPDKINEDNIRPVFSDVNFYTIKKEVHPKTSQELVDAGLAAQLDYMGSGNITLFMDSKLGKTLLLSTDGVGNRKYKSLTDLATVMFVNKIVLVDDLFAKKSTIPINDEGTQTVEAHPLFIGLDLNDYASGADKGGNVSLFDDFDIDFNQYKYLLETRCSGALRKPKSAFVAYAKHDTHANVSSLIKAMKLNYIVKTEPVEG